MEAGEEKSQKSRSPSAAVRTVPTGTTTKRAARLGRRALQNQCWAGLKAAAAKAKGARFGKRPLQEQITG